MSFAPLGIFASMTCVTAEYGFAVLIPLAKYIATVYLSCAFCKRAKKNYMDPRTIGYR